MTLRTLLTELLTRGNRLDDEVKIQSRDAEGRTFFAAIKSVSEFGCVVPDYTELINAVKEMKLPC